MKIVADSVSLDVLRQMAEETFGDMVKAVVDVRRELLAVQAEMHSDLEALLLEDGSGQGDLWGINLYPDRKPEGLIEFNSLINIRPSSGNRSRSVESEATRSHIALIVRKRITP
jgi:hypothetical protein